MIWIGKTIENWILNTFSPPTPIQLITHPHPTHSLSIKSSSSSSQPQTSTSLLDLLKSHCHSLTSDDLKYQPTPYLFNGHLQTLYCAMTNSSTTHQVHYERKIIRVPDGGQIEIDFSPPRAFDDPHDSTPTLVVLHGLTGGSHESYVRAAICPIIAELGWRVMVPNFRGCAGAKVTSPKLYHAGATDDLRCALLFLSHLVSPKTPLHGLGFSLGGNILSKYLGEEGDQSLLRTAVAVSNPWDLYKGHLFLESSFVQRTYSRVLAFSLRSMVKRHLHSFPPSSPLDVPKLFSDPYQTLYDFDTIVTRVLGGFPSTEEYYKSQSSARVARDVRVPLLGINAEDDVIACVDGVPLEAAQENPFLVFAITKRGGHLGWFEGILFPQKRFIDRIMIQWFSALNDHLDCSAPSRASQPDLTQPITVGQPMVRDKDRPEEIGFEWVEARTVLAMEGVAQRLGKEVIKESSSLEFLKLLVWDGGRSKKEDRKSI